MSARGSDALHQRQGREHETPSVEAVLDALGDARGGRRHTGAVEAARSAASRLRRRRHAAVGPPPFRVDVRPARESVWLVPVGELDVVGARSLRAEVDELVAVGFAHVVIDLREIAFMDCAGLRPLLRLTADARHGRWRLSLIRGSEAVDRLLVATGTLDVLPFRSPDDAGARGRSLTPARYAGRPDRDARAR